MATDPDDLELSDVEETVLFLEKVDAFEPRSVGNWPTASPREREPTEAPPA